MMEVERNSVRVLETAIHKDLYESLSPIEPSEEARLRIFSSVKVKINERSLLSTTQTDNLNAFKDGGWTPYLPLIDIKILKRDENRTSAVFRMQPNARFVPHRHSGQEEILILNGELFIDGQHFVTGDYQLSDDGSEHNDVYTNTGCVALVTAPTSIFRI